MIKVILCVLACAASAASYAESPKVQGGMIVDDDGMTLYTFDRDTAPGASACTGGCAAIWPAAIADSYDKPSGDWGLIAAAQGKHQWTYKGHPLYRFSGDKAAGQKNGDGVKGIWHVARPG